MVLANRLKGMATQVGFMGGLLGLVFFILLFDTKLLHPKAVEWLLDPINQDAIQHFVGWEFFRFEPWHIPFGQINNYGYPDVTSIVYTDSIPLLALIFKLFSPILPASFQYFGLWYLACFILQGTMAWNISGLLRQDCPWLIRTLLTLFFLISPIMLDRMAAHHALTAHGLILAGFYLYLRPYSRSLNYYWLLLNAVTLLIHAYLAVMVLFLWIAYLVKQSVVTKNNSLSASLFYLLLNGSVLLCLAWCSGYFVILPTSNNSGVYLSYAMNLLSPFVPTQGSLIVPGSWSRFVDNYQPLRWGQAIEGFNYWGMGMLCLMICALGKLIQKPIKNRVWLVHAPLLFSCLCLATFACSNQIYLGSIKLASYQMPSLMIIPSQVFRAGGRFFWPMYYLVMIASFAILVNRMSARMLTVLLVASFSLQYIELSSKINALSSFLVSHLNSHSSHLLLNTERISDKYHHLVFLPNVLKPGFEIKQFGEYIDYAARHQITVNQGYFARYNRGLSYMNTQHIQSRAYRGDLNKETIYVLLDVHLARFLKKRIPKNTEIIQKDGYTIFLPGRLSLER